MLIICGFSTFVYILDGTGIGSRVKLNYSFLQIGVKKALLMTVEAGFSIIWFGLVFSGKNKPSIYRIKSKIKGFQKGF